MTSPFKRVLTIAVILAMAATLLGGCSGETDSAPADAKAPDQRSAAATTPEQLALEVYAAVQRRDFDAFRRHCITKSEMVATLDAAEPGTTGDTKRKIDRQRKHLDDKFAYLEEDLKENFSSALRHVDLSSAQVKDVIVMPFVDAPFQEKTIYILLSNKGVIQINGALKTPYGWRMIDKNPLSETSEEVRKQLRAIGIDA